MSNRLLWEDMVLAITVDNPQSRKHIAAFCGKRFNPSRKGALRFEIFLLFESAIWLQCLPMIGTSEVLETVVSIQPTNAKDLGPCSWSGRWDVGGRAPWYWPPLHLHDPLFEVGWRWTWSGLDGIESSWGSAFDARQMRSLNRDCSTGWSTWTCCTPIFLLG